MKLTNIIQRRLAQLLIAVMGVACFSCSEDISERGGDIDHKQKEGISVTVATKDIATRALTSFDGDAVDNELIHTCVVVFVNAGDGKVAEVKDLDESDIKGFNVILGAGEYKAFAFANIDKDALTGLSFTKGSDFGEIDNEVFDVDADNLTADSNIPMSGYLYDIEVASNGTVTLNGIPTNEVTITVVRMVGKLEFQFSNDSSSEITITEISVKPKASGVVELLPTWKEFGKTLESPNMELEGVEVKGSIERTLTDFTIEKDKGKDYSFYVREMKSNLPTGRFPIRIKYKKGTSAVEDTLTALLYDLTEINRNDWIRIPITLTDYKLKLDVEFYPPIGGYPPVNWTDVDDEYYVSFATGGWFSIETSVVNKANGTEIDTKKVEITKVEYDENASEFFRKKPAIEASGELTGEIRSPLTTVKSSVVTITVKVTNTNGAETPFKRKIHFIYSPPSTSGS